MKHGVSSDIRQVITNQLKQIIDDLEEMYPSVCTECLAISLMQEVIHLSSERYTHKGDGKHVKS
jgi:hypothetical protein